MLTAVYVAAPPGTEAVISPVVPVVTLTGTDPGPDSILDDGIIPLLGLPRHTHPDPAHTLRLAVIGLRSQLGATLDDLDEIAALLAVGEAELALERVVSLRTYVASATALGGR
jgi:hypothetical protein